MADSQSELSVDEKQPIMHKMINRLIVNRMMDLEDKETGGDDFLFWTEENAGESAKRINELNENLCTFHGNCGKLAAEWGVNKRFPRAEALVSQLDLFSEECRVLHEEYAKSAAELCIKKMRLGALVEKIHKRRTLMIEIIMARKIWEKFGDRFTGLIENSVSGSSNDKLGSTYNSKVVGFTRESYRVLVEMMRGVKDGTKSRVKGLDDALALGKRWADAVMGKCVLKVWVGTVVDRHSVFEVLKREIAENWKMEREVRDRILIYQREQQLARIAPVFATDIVEESSIVATVGDEIIELKKSEGGDLTKHPVEKHGLVWRKSGMIAPVAEFGIGKVRRRFPTMSWNEETKEDSKAKSEQRMRWLDKVKVD